MSVVTPTILSSGQPIDAAFDLLSMEIVKEVNRIPLAQLTFSDGSVAQQTFSVSNSEVFEPGKEIEIKLRYERNPDNETTVFKGVVVKQRVRASAQGSRFTVLVKDKAVKLTLERRNVIYREKTDHAIVKEIAESKGLGIGTIDTSESEHLELVQYDATDWDFMLSRAELNGLLLNANDGQLSLVKPTLDGDALYTFEYGIDDIYDFEIETDAGHQYPEVQSVAWDMKEQTLTKATIAQAFPLTQGNLDGGKTASAIGAEPVTFIHPVSLEQSELQAWSDGLMVYNRLAMIRGYLRVLGIEAIKPLDLIEVAGIGDRFNGKTIATGIRHQLNTNGWETAIQFGLSPQRFTERRDLASPPASGHLPPIHGLHIGVIAPFEEDPNKELRVKVILPGMNAEGEAIWARLATLDAGKDRGILFRPESGDEVVVGFFNNDPRQAVILGSMFSNTNNSPETLEAPSVENVNKGIVSKSGTKIQWVDNEKASIFIETPESNKVLLDDDNQTIEITDQHGNMITLSQNGIEIKSASDIRIEASGDVKIKGSTVDVS